MATQCCLLGAAPADIPRLTRALGVAVPAIDITIALFDVAMLHALAPRVIVIDADSLKVEPLEAVRQLRFVLPQCTIVIYAKALDDGELRGFHNAGANAILSKSSSEGEIVTGLRRAIASGCFTDPRFASPWA